MAKIVISEFMDTRAVGELWSAFKVEYEPTLVDRPDELAATISDAAALVVRNRTQVTEELLSGAPNLKCVGRLGVGLDNIDQEACARRGIEVYPAIGANNQSVAEYVITSAMVLLRNAYLSREAMFAGEWPRQQCSGRELAGSVLGLVGFGGIAQLTAKMAAGLGVTVIAFDPYLPPENEAWDDVERCNFDELLERSDAISLHTPLTEDTRHLINARALSKMKNDAVLINAARGGVVDEKALVAALRDEGIAGAALDVFENEPLNAIGARKFMGIHNLLLTPHVAGVTQQSNTRVSAVIAEKVASHLGTNL